MTGRTIRIHRNTEIALDDMGSKSGMVRALAYGIEHLAEALALRKA